MRFTAPPQTNAEYVNGMHDMGRALLVMARLAVQTSELDFDSSGDKGFQHSPEELRQGSGRLGRSSSRRLNLVFGGIVSG